jgi:DNA replication regulator SLD3
VSVEVHNALHALMASRGSPGVLEPTSSTTLNTLHGTHPPSKKRKLFHSRSGVLSTSLFCIKVCYLPGPCLQALPAVPAHRRFQGLGSSLSDDDFTLEPITLLLRSRLPFSWLDTSISVPSGRLFAATNPNLENDLCGWEEPTVLAARLVSNGTLYVLERVKTGIYALCRLSPSIDEGNLLVAAKEGHRSLRRKPLLDQSCDRGECADWREAARLKEDFLDMEPFGKRRKFDVSVVFETRQSNVLHEMDIVNDADAHLLPTTEQSRKESHFQTPPGEGTDIPQPNMEEQTGTADGTQTSESLLQSLRAQYLEALYISKVCWTLIY